MFKYRERVIFSTTLKDLYGEEEYAKHIVEGGEYFMFFENGSEVYKKTGKNWNVIKVTYIRSGVVFYIVPDVIEIPEDFFPIGCYISMTIHPKKLVLDEYGDEKFRELYRNGLFEFSQTPPVEIVM